MLNPSGMSLIRSYAVEGGYQYLRKGEGHILHASIVDSTSASNVGGALYYTYLTASPATGLETSGHETGVALSFPFGERFSLGGTAKYLHFDTAGTLKKGFVFDAGATIRPAPGVALAVVGYNLRNLDIPLFPRALGGGASVGLMPDLLITLDAVGELSDAPAGRDKAVSVMGGAEYVFAKKVAVRGGGGRDGMRKNGYVSAGLSLLSETGALDLGLRQDVSGAIKETFAAASARLFVPAP
jgi:hypothetical protein